MLHDQRVRKINREKENCEIKGFEQLKQIFIYFLEINVMIFVTNFRAKMSRL